LLAIGTSAGALWSAAAPAVAAPAFDMLVPTSTYGPNCTAGQFSGTLCKTDNAAVTYYMDSSGTYELEAPDRTAVQAAMTRWDNATDLSIAYDSSPVFSGAGDTDVVYQEGDTGVESAVGLTWCDDPQDGTNYLCDQQYVRIRGNGAITETTAAHETGHAFGLTHGAQAFPVQGQCDAAMGIMRASASCLPGPALGAVPKDNVNWEY